MILKLNIVDYFEKKIFIILRNNVDYFVRNFRFMFLSCCQFVFSFSNLYRDDNEICQSVNPEHDNQNRFFFDNLS